MERGGEQIGIIGYTTKSTPFVSNPGNKLIILQKKNVFQNIQVYLNCKMARKC